MFGIPITPFATLQCHGHGKLRLYLAAFSRFTIPLVGLGLRLFRAIPQESSLVIHASQTILCLGVPRHRGQPQPMRTHFGVHGHAIAFHQMSAKIVLRGHTSLLSCRAVPANGFGGIRSGAAGFNQAQGKIVLGGHVALLSRFAKPIGCRTFIVIATFPRSAHFREGKLRLAEALLRSLLKKISGCTRFGRRATTVTQPNAEVVLGCGQSLLGRLAKPANRLSFIRFHSEPFGETNSQAVLSCRHILFSSLTGPFVRLGQILHHTFTLPKMPCQIPLAGGHALLCGATKPFHSLLRLGVLQSFAGQQQPQIVLRRSKILLSGFAIPFDGLGDFLGAVFGRAQFDTH